MKLYRVLAIDDWVTTGLERSKWGSIVQIMSPPKIKTRLFKEGRILNNLFMKHGLSKLGAYTLTSRVGTRNSVPNTIRNLPSLSEVVVVNVNGTDLPIKMATPLAFELKLEWSVSANPWAFKSELVFISAKK